MELKKSKWLLGLVVAGGLFCGTASFAAEEKVEGIKLPAAVVSKLQDLMNALDTPGAVAKMCGRGSGFSKITIRSGSGAFCAIHPVTAAFAEALCLPSNPDEYAVKGNQKSDCHRKALATLGGQTPKAVLSSAIKADPSGIVAQIICEGDRQFPEGGIFASIKASACDEAKAMMKKK